MIRSASLIEVLALAVAAGATTPAPAAPCWVWSTVEGKMLYWTGSVWSLPVVAPSPAAITRAAVTITPAQFGQAIVNVVDAGVTPTSKIICSLEPTADWEAEDLQDVSVLATPNTGSVDFCIQSPGPIGGDYDILYMIG